MSRTCPFCDAPIRPELFACPKHWYAMTEVSRREIWSAYRLYLAGSIGMNELKRQQQAVIDREMLLHETRP